VLVAMPFIQTTQRIRKDRESRTTRARRAAATLEACGVAIGTPFEALTAAQSAKLLAHAESHRLATYGPTIFHRLSPSVRSFHDLLQRRAVPPFKRAGAAR
jgi:hypothetical protein